VSVADIIAVVCGHVLRDERPVRLVVHHADDGWQFTCGGHDHPQDVSDFGTIHIGHLLARQPNLNVCLTLDRGYLAEASADGWDRAAHDD
jgi:hypothetical protein